MLTPAQANKLYDIMNDSDSHDEAARRFAAWAKISLREAKAHVRRMASRVWGFSY